MTTESDRLQKGDEAQKARKKGTDLFFLAQKGDGFIFPRHQQKINLSPF
jgi:hypothetical protein